MRVRHWLGRRLSLSIAVGVTIAGIVSLMIVVVLPSSGRGAVAAGLSATCFPKSVSGRLDSLALSFAKSVGDKHPTAIYAAASNRESANRVMDGDIILSKVPVYVVAMRGYFKVDTNGPPEAPPYAYGRSATFILGSNFGVEDYGLSDGPVLSSMRKFGCVTQLGS